MPRRSIDVNESAHNRNFRRLAVHWPLLLIFGVWFTVFFDINTGQAVVGYRDSAYLYYPYFQWIDTQWASGQIPLWNPYCDLGYPVIGDCSSSVFYPGKLIFLCRFLDYPVRYGVYLSMHVLFAACTSYLLTLRMGAKPIGAGLSGFSYAFGGSVLFQLTNVIYLVSAAWLPLGFLFLFKLRRSNDWNSVIMLSVVASMMILGGDPQMAYMLVVIALLSGVGQLVWCRNRYRTWNIWFAKLFLGFRKLALFVVVASALSAIQLLPTSVWSQQSKRVDNQSISINEKSLEPHAGSHLHAVYQFSQPPWTLAELVWPNFSGKLFPDNLRWTSGLPGADRIWTPSLYIGAFTFFFAMNGCCFFYGSRRRNWMTWLALFFAFSSFGWYGGVWLIRELASCFGFSGLFLESGVGNSVGGLYWMMTVALPGFDTFRYPAKLFVVASLAICVLGGIGFSQKRVACRAVVFALVTVLISIAGIFYGHQMMMSFVSQRQVVVYASQFFGPFDVDVWSESLSFCLLQALAVYLFLMLFCLTVRVRFLSDIHRRSLNMLIFVLAMVDLSLANHWLLCSVSVDAFTKPTEVHSQIAKAETDGPFLRLSHDSVVPDAWERVSSSERLAEIVYWQRNSLHPKHHLLVADEFGLELNRSFTSIEHRSLARWHILAWRDGSTEKSRKLVNGSISTDRKSGAHDLKVKSPTNQKVRLVAAGQDLSRARADDEFKEMDDASWELVSRDCNSLHFKIEAGEPGIFVCNMLPDPGWRVKVLDGTQEVVSRRSYSVGQFHLAVEFPAGNHEIQMEYVPREFWIGMWVSAVGCFSLIGWTIRSWMSGKVQSRLRLKRSGNFT